MRPVCLILSAVLLLTACSDPLPYFESASLTPVWKHGRSAMHVVNDFALTDQSGNTISADSLAGSVYVANFFFSRCSGICPTLRSRMTKVRDAFPGRTDLKLVSFSVDPTYDRSDILEGYARINGIDSKRWHLLTGSESQVGRIARESFFLDGLEGDRFVHTENVYLVDASGHIRGVYNGTQAFDIQRLIEDAAVLLRG